MASPSLSVVLAEPNALLREKIAGVIGRHAAVWCVVQVPSGEALLRGAEDLGPDLVLADLPILLDARVVARLRALRSRPRLVALVDAESPPYAGAAARLGLDGVVEKGRAGEAAEAIFGRLAGQSTVGGGAGG